MPIEFNYQINYADSPFWSFAIHDGHHLDNRLQAFIKIGDLERLREEDPHTAKIANLGVNQFIIGTSRFQLDINRKLEDAVYIRPDQAWGLEVWKQPLPQEELDLLYQKHNEIYELIESQLEYTIRKHGYFIVFDIHSYNAKRQNSEEVIDQNSNPQINLGTYYNHPSWDKLTNRLIQFIKSKSLYTKEIDIRENIKFKGGYLAQHLTNTFGNQGCVWSVEFRKDFMNEWTGETNSLKIQECRQLLLDVIEDFIKDPIHVDQQ